MTTEYGVRYSSGITESGWTLAGARRLVAGSTRRNGLRRDAQFHPAPVTVVRRDVGPWTVCDEDQPPASEGASE